MATALYADPICKGHDPGRGHPESPLRFDAALAGIERAGLLDKLLFPAVRDPAREDLTMVHDALYLARAEAEIRSGEDQLSTGDTALGPDSWEAALRAAGCGMGAVDAVFEGKCANAFCITRPPGHHATPERGMGFCILNNVALAARHAQRSYGIQRVAIIDWDVHHGNGTQDAFYADGSVFFFSTHQVPWYPGTGAADETGIGAGKGSTLNCPLPAGSGRSEVFSAFEAQFLPAMESFRPELVLISAGFDSRAGDPLGQFLLTDEDFSELTKLSMALAARFASGRLVSLLEGGYSLSGLAGSVAAHVATLSEQ